MSTFGTSPDGGPGTSGSAPSDPASSMRSEPDPDETPAEPSPDASEVEGDGEHPEEQQSPT